MMKDLLKSFSGAVPLKRKGSRLSSPLGSWQMQGVYGPLSMENSNNREFFRIETSNQETLWVWRQSGEKGMRELFLFDISLTESHARAS